ncbi:MAG TPA: radical SAM protein [Bryobacteraceae bacterium]|nr:radical SAM protein [Bryobacteraceae bacterium]
MELEHGVVGLDGIGAVDLDFVVALRGEREGEREKDERAQDRLYIAYGRRKGENGRMLFDASPGPRLVGIAKLASESERLEAKRKVEYFEIATRSVLNRSKPSMPFTWTINPYRGCEFGCKYCYARYTHEFMELDPADFENRIYAKAGVEEILKLELRRTDKREAIALGTATDPYQPAERRFERTRRILEVFARERGWHLSITTKSDLVERDIALLMEIARANVLDVNITVTTLDAKLARMLEPRAPRPDLRLATVEKLAGAGIVVGVFPNPILPLITDRERDLDRLARAAKNAGASYFGGGVLFLMPSAQKIFFPFLRENFPRLLRRYEERYTRSPYIRGAYMETLRDRLRKIRARYGLASAPVEYRPELWEDEKQQELFPLD